MNRTFDFCLDIVLNIDRDKPRIVEPKKKKKKQGQKETPSQEEEHKEELPANGEAPKEEKVLDAHEEQSHPKYRQIDPSEIKETAIPYFDHNLFDLYEPNIEELTKHLVNPDAGSKEESVYPFLLSSDLT